MLKEAKVEEAWKKKYPERVVLAVTCDREGKPNIIPLGWCMQTSFHPPLVAISVGHARYSHQLLSESKEFVLAFPNKDMGREVLYWGTHSGRDEDKLAKTEVKVTPSRFVKPPLLSDCVINFECKVVEAVETGDHTIFVGKILAAYVNESQKDILLNFGNYRFGGVKKG